MTKLTTAFYIVVQASFINRIGCLNSLDSLQEESTGLVRLLTVSDRASNETVDSHTSSAFRRIKERRNNQNSLKRKNLPTSLALQLDQDSADSKAAAEVSLADDNSQFCFSIYIDDDGASAINDTKDLLIKQYAERKNIFACNAYAVYSNVQIPLHVTGDKEFMTTQMDDVGNRWRSEKKTQSGKPEYINTAVFISAQERIKEDGNYGEYEWIVQVNPTTVYIPNRFKLLIETIHIPSIDYIESCQLNKGIESNKLEIYRRVTFLELLESVENCSRVINWKGIFSGNPILEASFASACLNSKSLVGVKIDDLDLCQKEDGVRKVDWLKSCDTTVAALYNIKTPDDWLACYDKMITS